MAQTTDAAAPASTAPPRRTPASATLRTLLVQRACLVIVTLVMLVTSLVTLREMERGVAEMRTRTAPAALEIGEARRALAAADRAALAGFAEGESRLTGFRPGEEYQYQLDIANQSLAQAAEDNSVGEEGGRILQMVEGLLVSYTGAIGRAGAHFQQGHTVLAASDLWNATRLMHSENGILAQLADLQAKEHARFRAEASAQWWTGWAALLWAGPLAVLLPLLLASQVYLARRFRRVLNLPLVLATAIVVIGAPLVVVHAADSRSELAAARRSLVQITEAGDAAVERAGTRGRHLMAGLLEDECPDGCGPTVDEFIERHRQSLPPERDQDSSDRSIADSRRIDAAIAKAQLSTLTAPGVSAAALAVLALIVWGFHPRIGEYRFEAR